MKLEEIKSYCLGKWKAYEDYPFGDIPICYKLEGKVFAQIYFRPEDYKITLKCTADAGQFYRQVYSGVVVRGYHCPPVQQPYWNTIDLNRMPDKELLNMIDQAYTCVLHSFSKKRQKRILEAGEIVIRTMERSEFPILEDFLYDAIYQKEGEALLPREVIYRPEIMVYIQDFGQMDDICMVAEAEGMIIGAVWTRILAYEIKGFGNIDADTPEFAISVKKEFRGQGIGTRLMKEMIKLLSGRGYRKAFLSVDKENYARWMYAKLGFQILEEREEDCLMVLDFF